jgi:hypothetical protein
MVVENPTWGAPRIHGELLMHSFDVSVRTISRWMKPVPRDIYGEYPCIVRSDFPDRRFRAHKESALAAGNSWCAMGSGDVIQQGLLALPDDTAAVNHS